MGNLYTTIVLRVMRINFEMMLQNNNNHFENAIIAVYRLVAVYIVQSFKA